MSTATRENPTRDAMINSTIALLRENGLTGTSVRDVVEHSGAPRGSIYHHFPGGKTEMVDAAIERAGAAISAAIDYAETSSDPAAALEILIDFFKQLLVSTDFRAGCPIAAVSAEADQSDGVVTAAAAAVFDAWRGKIAAIAENDGFEPARAQSLANLTLAALEGALLMSRVSRTTEPLDDVAAELKLLLGSAPGQPEHSQT
jgi:AcrR family transcriptional regulator